MKVGDYVRTKTQGIKKVLDIGSFVGMKQYKIDEEGKYTIDSSIIKSSPDVVDLIETMDLMYIDICPDDCGGIVAPRIAETPAELKIYKEHFKDGSYILRGIITKEQLESMEYRIGG